MATNIDQPTCPHCEEGVTFDLQIRGRQEKARFAVSTDGGVTVAQAGSVEITSYDEDELVCRRCGETTSEDDLITRE
jgi:ribosomal protein S27AE